MIAFPTPIVWRALNLKITSLCCPMFLIVHPPIGTVSSEQFLRRTNIPSGSTDSIITLLNVLESIYKAKSFIGPHSRAFKVQTFISFAPL